MSTLVQYVEAKGGELLRLTVRFPEGEVKVDAMGSEREDRREE